MEKKVIPISRDPSNPYMCVLLASSDFLPSYKKRVLNNTMSHSIITPTWCCGFNVMLFACILFTGLGYILYSEADSIREFEVRYDEVCASVRGTGEPCSIEFTPDVDIKNPKVYYRLDNFYQNHRSFQKYSFAQLRGEDEADVKISQCEDVQTNHDMIGNTAFWDISSVYPEELKTGQLLDKNAWPCGQISKFRFSDVFVSVRSLDRSFSVQIDDTDIAHSTDIEKRFKRNDDLVQAGRYWDNPENEHLMVWYQMESLKDFVKLYGRIEGTLKADKTYTFTVFDNYASEKIGNKKYVLFSEVGTFGGKNFILAYFFGVAACMSMLVMIFFIIGYFMCVQGRRIEEESYIKRLSY